MKDPYLKPVIFGGLFITILSLIFGLGIIIWSLIGGYITLRVANKITKEVVSLLDGLLLGIFSGIIGGTCLNILTFISFRTPDNQRLLIRILEKNWPKEITPPGNFHEILPSLFVTVCLFIIVITTAFSALGAYIGIIVSKKK